MNDSLWGRVACGGEVVSVTLHVDGLQPVGDCSQGRREFWAAGLQEGGVGSRKKKKSERLGVSGLALPTFNNLRKNYKRFYSYMHHFFGTHLYNIASRACNMHLCATAKSIFTAIYHL